MSKTLCEQASEQLSAWLEELPPGSRVLVSTSEPCGCDNSPRSPHQNRCHVCNGAGVVLDAKTFLSQPTESP